MAAVAAPPPVEKRNQRYLSRCLSRLMCFGFSVFSGGLLGGERSAALASGLCRHFLSVVPPGPRHPPTLGALPPACPEAPKPTPVWPARVGGD